MDNIIITKIWSDTDFFEAEIKFLSEYLTVTQPFYLQEYMINNAVNELSALCGLDKPEIDLNSGEPDSKDLPALSMHISADKTGHVKADVTVSITDGSDPVHKCSFFINSEIGLIDAFIEKLKKLSAMAVGCSIYLNTDDE